MTDQVIDHVLDQDLDLDLDFGLEPARAAAAAAAGPAERWTYVCRYADLIAGRGVAALVDGIQVAVFRLADGSLHAVGNYDPGSRAHVISRGLTGTHEGVRTVVSPIYKDLFDLRTGRCLTKEGLTLPVYPVFRHRGLVFCQGDPLPARRSSTSTAAGTATTNPPSSTTSIATSSTESATTGSTTSGTSDH